MSVSGQAGSPRPTPGRLDGVTFEVIVHRRRERRPDDGGPWLVRVYAAGEHVHSAEGGVPLFVGLNEAHRAMARWLTENGAP
jgi:hypothetical protein